MNDLSMGVFEFLRDVAMATNFLFPKFRFFRRNSKTTRDRNTVLLGKENVGNFVFCLMAPSVMTSGEPESQNLFRFVLLLRVRSVQKVRDRPSPFFSPAGRPTGVDDSCETGSPFLKGRCHGNKFSSFSDIFRRSGRCFCIAQSPFVQFVV